MSSPVKQILQRIQRSAKRRANRVITRAMGRQHYFRAYDIGDDTFIFERGVWLHLDAHASVLIIPKKDLRHNGGPGFVMTVTTGNHSVAALPLLQGQFWDLCTLSQQKRTEMMMHGILCANVVNGKLEISQRDVSCSKLVAADEWLTGTWKFANQDVVMVERNVQTLEHYRMCGQEWRVRPLAWTEKEMSAAINASRKRISTSARYFHGSRGVHFLTYSDFRKMLDLASADFPEFRKCLHELVSIFEGHTTSFMRQPKFHGHHEIELFGLRRGVAIKEIVPQLELLMEKIELRNLTSFGDDELKVLDEIDKKYKANLTRPELLDEKSKIFTELLYMHLTGEVYSVMSEGATPAFDDRRTALPGAKFENGRPVYDPLCDKRNEVLLSNLRALASRDEFVEYANVYELRTKDEECDLPIGKGTTREIVYKTNRRPLVASLVEKRLSRTGKGYGSYVLARAQAFKSLGICLPDYRLLQRRMQKVHRNDYFLRTRCEGEPLADIPASHLQLAGEFGGVDAGEDPQVVAALAALMGDAAAQNLVMKKYDAASKSPLFNVGKEIYRFGYDINFGRHFPQSVSYCSVRGSLGWPDLSYNDRNLEAIAGFYLSHYAKSVIDFAAKHQVCTKEELGEKFFSGFEFRLRAMEWSFTVQRNEFEEFNPELKSRYGFLPKWRFALWALERHVRRIADLRRKFFKLLENPEQLEFSVPTEDMSIMGDANAENVLNALDDLEIHFIGET